MESQVLHTVWCNISGKAAVEIWYWSLELDGAGSLVDTTAQNMHLYWGIGELSSYNELRTHDYYR